MASFVSLATAEPHAFPVPYVARDTAAHNGRIQFKDLPGPGSIRIFTVNGEEVQKISINPGDLILPWDVKNSAGKPVQTGVYIYQIDGGGQQTSGKLVVIR